MKRLWFVDGEPLVPEETFFLGPIKEKLDLIADTVPVMYRVVFFRKGQDILMMFSSSEEEINEADEICAIITRDLIEINEDYIDDLNELLDEKMLKLICSWWLT